MYGKAKSGDYIIDKKPARLGAFPRLERVKSESQRLILEVLSGHPGREYGTKRV